VGSVAVVRRLAHTDAILDAKSQPMRTTLTIDDELFAKAVALAAPDMEKSELLRECVKAFIQRQTARRLAALGGQVPEIEQAPRRHPDPPTP
jgi:Arc/MetJ family transcription regulator